MPDLKTFEIPVKGMDCADCVRHVEHALGDLPGVESVQVFLTAEKAVLTADPLQATLPAIRKAVEAAGYSVPDERPGEQKNLSVGEPGQEHNELTAKRLADFTRPVLTLFGIVFGVVLFVIVFGEWLGLFEKLTERVPWYLGWAVVAAGGYPVFLNVIRAALKKQVISHTLMTLGVLAALAVGQWATAAVVVFFMRVGDYAEHFTTERARRAVKDLTALAPQTARVERTGSEVEVPVGEVSPGEVVVVRPGERIPVDGEVVTGQATINQAAITGESMPVEAVPGSRVYAATLAQLGSLRVQTTATGRDTTFGRVIQLVEEAEAHRASVQRIADKFSAYYLPVVSAIALLTFVLRRDPLATAAVLVVACSCSFALATPIAMLASIGAGAKRGLLIKGGKYLESLAQADVLLVDKTGTLTLGRPEISRVVPLDGLDERELLGLAASAERYSEHPLAEAVREAARVQGIALHAVTGFESLPGQGVTAQIDGEPIWVGSRRIILDDPVALQADPFEAQGNTILWVTRGGKAAGFLAAADTVRPEVPQAIAAIRKLGIQQIELLTGDNERTAAGLAERLGVSYRANLLPEQKIAIVKEYQAQGRTVVMVGDGVNDAPALAQADIGIAMGAAGSDVAVEAAHIALMREDWMLVPQVFQIARRTMRVVKTNIAFTAVYNLVGLSLAAFGILPPILAAAAQSLPDIGILANSSRLIRQ
jgi:Cd2+/Zn2+-exporting ATPase/Cu+-exporting ATPase